MSPAYSRLSPLKWLVLSACLALTAALAGPARAADDTQRAKELFQQGTTLFNVGEFDKAIEAWQAGYKEKPDPGFLYNIGQAYRLKGDAPKAIFFYRGYLRNSPKAANRADVETKIATLQKGVEEHTPPAVTPVPAPAPSASPPPAVPVAAPPRATPPAPRPAQTRNVPPPVAAPPLPAAVVTTRAPATPEVPGRNRPIDLSLLVGINAFTSGLRISGDAPAQFAGGIGGGYTFGDAFGAVSFRLGALVYGTSLQEGMGNTANTLGFTSILAEPSLRIRVMARRLYLTGGLGVGAVVISSVKSSSVVLAVPPPGRSFDVQGAQGGFELRPAVGVQLHLVDWLALVVSPALAFTPKKDNFYGTLGRFELLFGLTVLL